MSNDPTPFLPNIPLKHIGHNPNVKTTHNYNIVDDLAQPLMAMSTLEVLQTYPSPKKALLSTLSTIDRYDS